MSALAGMGSGVWVVLGVSGLLLVCGIGLGVGSRGRGCGVVVRLGVKVVRGRCGVVVSGGWFLFFYHRRASSAMSVYVPRVTSSTVTIRQWGMVIVTKPIPSETH